MPASHEISYMPKNVKIDSEFFGFEISYEHKEDRIIATKDFYVSYLLLEPESFEEWNKANKKYSQAVRNTIVLKKKIN